MVLSGTEYLIAVMAAFLLFFVVLVLFLFGGMTWGVIIRTESLPLSSAIVMADEGLSYGRGGSFLGSGLRPNANIDMGFSILFPPQYTWIISNGQSSNDYNSH